MSPARLTKQQKAALDRLRTEGYVMHQTAFGRSQGNRPFWKLVELGLADFEFGPKGSWLQCQGFVPTTPTAQEGD